MEIKGIDVSSYQGKPDWAKVAASGIKFALLRIHQQDGADSSFEHNYKGCKNNGILVGGYKYSYALTVAQAEAEADAVLGVLGGRGLDFPVFYDLEWSKQRSQCSRTKITQIAKAFLEKVKKAGYKVGIYCNVDWYNNALDTGSLPYDYWLAAYPYNDNGTIQERLRPKAGVGWQYSSKGTVPGISGAVDMDVFYKDYKEAISVSDLWTKTAELMAAQSGYMEKASNANLDSKTGNAGSGNYTKYARDVNNMGLMGCQGQPWCAVYQFWVCAQIFGKAKALEIMGGGFYNCTSVKNYAKSRGTWHTTPKLGALIIFRNGAHIGRVTKVTDTQVYTNEGNTSAGGTNNVVPNGGCVADKVYTRNYSGIDGYVWIDYGTEAKPATPTSNKVPVTKKVALNMPKLSRGCNGVAVKMLQQMLGVKVDGDFGADTEAVLKAFQKNVGLSQTGVCTVSVWKAIVAHMVANTYRR